MPMDGVNAMPSWLCEAGWARRGVQGGPCEGRPCAEGRRVAGPPIKDAGRLQNAWLESVICAKDIETIERYSIS